MRLGLTSRGYLPHLQVQGGSYFVTFRLADSLPREVMERLNESKVDQHARSANTTAPDAFDQQLDALLDEGRGDTCLRRSDIAEMVAKALKHFNGQRYTLHAWVVMPNHVHVVVAPFAQHSLESVLHSWKSFTASTANRRLGRMGKPFWQKESYDHWVRGQDELDAYIRYTENNPVKAGLCGQPHDWPWSSASV